MFDRFIAMYDVQKNDWLLASVMTEFLSQEGKIGLRSHFCDGLCTHWHDLNRKRGKMRTEVRPDPSGNATVRHHSACFEDLSLIDKGVTCWYRVLAAYLCTAIAAALNRGRPRTSQC